MMSKSSRFSNAMRASKFRNSMNEMTVKSSNFYNQIIRRKMVDIPTVIIKK